MKIIEIDVYCVTVYYDGLSNYRNHCFYRHIVKVHEWRLVEKLLLF